MKPSHIHVIPVGDLKEHTHRSEKCNCQPRIEPVKDGVPIVIHTAYDGREFAEAERRARCLIHQRFCN